MMFLLLVVVFIASNVLLVGGRQRFKTVNLLLFQLVLQDVLDAFERIVSELDHFATRLVEALGLDCPSQVEDAEAHLISLLRVFGPPEDM